LRNVISFQTGGWLRGTAVER